MVALVTAKNVLWYWSLAEQRRRRDDATLIDFDDGRFAVDEWRSRDVDGLVRDLVVKFEPPRDVHDYWHHEHDGGLVPA